MYPELNDDLGDLLDNSGPRRIMPADDASVRMRASVESFSDVCPKCHGSGRYRHFGPCFTCKGAGSRTFKTSAATRATARENATVRASAKADSLLESFDVANPGVRAYLESRSARWPFAADLLVTIGKYGDLTPGQLGAVISAQARDAAPRPVIAAPSVDVSRVLAALQTATANGLKNPKLRLGAFAFSLAKATSANAGAVYVKAGAAYMGKIAAGRFHASRECNPSQGASIATLAADPAGSAVAYGRTMGACSCCGRALSDPVSVAQGIGPICAGKFGF